MAKKFGIPYEGDMIGRCLTIDRARELNAKNSFYLMLKDNPAMTAIYPGIEDELMVGAIDHHIHAYPDFVYRAQDFIEVAIDASKAGMRALGFKDHYMLTANAAHQAQRYIDDMVARGELEHRIEIYGGYGCCLGMDPETIGIALKYPNFKMIWFPTFTSYGYKRGAELPTDGGVRMVDDNGEVYSNVVEIMHMAAEAKVGIGLGHTDIVELLPLCQKGKEFGNRVVLDHPLLELNKLTIDEMKACADLGAYVGTYCQPMIPSLYQAVADPFETIETIRVIGADRCLIGSDFGQVLHVKTIDGIRIFIRALLAFGISREEIKVMLNDNPAKLMYLED